MANPASRLPVPGLPLHPRGTLRIILIITIVAPATAIPARPPTQTIPLGTHFHDSRDSYIARTTAYAVHPGKNSYLSGSPGIQ